MSTSVVRPCAATTLGIEHRCAALTDPGRSVVVRPDAASVVQRWLTGQSRSYLPATYLTTGDVHLCSAAYLRIMRDNVVSTKDVMVSEGPSQILSPPMMNIQGRCNVGDARQRILDITGQYEIESRKWHASTMDVNTFVRDFLAFVWKNEAELRDWSWRWIFPISTILPVPGETPLPDAWKSFSTFSELADRLIPSIVHRFSAEANLAEADSGEELYNNDGMPELNLLSLSSPIKDLLSARLIMVLLQGLYEMKPPSPSTELLDRAERIINTLDVCLSSLELKNSVLFGFIAVIQTEKPLWESLADWVAVPVPSQVAPACFRVLNALIDVVDIFRLAGLRETFASRIHRHVDQLTVTVIDATIRPDNLVTVVAPLVGLVAKLNPLNDEASRDFFVACLQFAGNTMRNLGHRLEDFDQESRARYYRSTELVSTQSRRLLLTLPNQHSALVLHRFRNMNGMDFDKLVETYSARRFPAVSTIHRPLVPARKLLATTTFEKCFESIEKSVFFTGWGNVPPVTVLDSTGRRLKGFGNNGRILQEVMAMTDVAFDELVQQVVQASTSGGPSVTSSPDKVMGAAVETLTRTVRSFGTIDPLYTVKPIQPVPIIGFGTPPPAVPPKPKELTYRPQIDEDRSRSTTPVFEPDTQHEGLGHLYEYEGSVKSKGGGGFMGRMSSVSGAVGSAFGRAGKTVGITN
ncbi:hypothetical protein BC937DRAFT_92458 [Endogone sp. FLAS-F59071]|nr:hypothetical protein BC937DRAFT_92458 [Endogone sp. FLAS-F59071]|eukprot:RUS15431.1 hypothetical protein BC937DRAFT_92458 [Endogone sp. FLAS-F59071]